MEQQKARHKKDIADALAIQYDVPKLKAQKIVQGVLDTIINTLMDKGKIELRKFGTFKIRIRKAKKVRNPKTNESFILPERKTVVFKVSREVLKKLNANK